jgi:REP element-mobilizing transposase RayT
VAVENKVPVLPYHMACPAKYRRVAISGEVDETLKEVCEEISERYEIPFLDIGTEGDHAHFLAQSVPAYSPTKIVATIKSVIAREIFLKHPEVKKKLWGGEFWTDGHFISAASEHGDECVRANYVKSQGAEEQYKQLCKMTDESQPSLFDWFPNKNLKILRPLGRGFFIRHSGLGKQFFENFTDIKWWIMI